MGNNSCSICQLTNSFTDEQEQASEEEEVDEVENRIRDLEPNEFYTGRVREVSVQMGRYRYHLNKEEICLHEENKENKEKKESKEEENKESKDENNSKEPMTKQLVTIMGKDNSAIYFGELHHNNNNTTIQQKHGQGKQLFPDSTLYEGYWHANLPNGKGRIIHPTGYTYEGTWLNGKKQGKGRSNYENTSYYGEWRNDVPHGKGEERYPDGMRYVGEFVEGRRQGRGRLEWGVEGSVPTSGREERGASIREEASTEGNRCTSTGGGRCYTGDFASNLMHGEGQMVWPGEMIYTGEWKAGHRSGHGELVFQNGRKYVGQFSENVFHGEGVFSWPSGRVLRGLWRDGLPIQREMILGTQTSIDSEGKSRKIVEQE